MDRQNGYTRVMALEAVASGKADMVAFGRLFISNPDLVSRLRLDAPLDVLDSAKLYGGAAAGYTDYTALETGDDLKEADRFSCVWQSTVNNPLTDACQGKSCDYRLFRLVP